MILDLPLERLRRRRSAKWQGYGTDVLPLWVAEMDVDLAEPIRDRLAVMVAESDTGYAWAGDLPEAYAGFAARRWNLNVDPGRVYVLQDVMRGVLEVLRTGTAPGDGVVINPPVYQPFFATVEHAGRTVVEVPLLARADGGYDLDLPGLERAFAAGARAYVLCSPHNPVGRVWSATELETVVALCRRYDVLLLCDEIHGPLAYGGCFVPVHAVPGSADVVALVSASKAWNLAGLKCALVVAGSPRSWQVVAAMGEEVGYGAGLLGVAAARAAFTDGTPWLDALLGELDARRHELARLLAERLPAVRYRVPDATYLAWLDCRDLGLADPHAHFLAAGVALEAGPKFGTGGAGLLRLNFACSSEMLEQALDRMAGSLT